STTGGNDGSSVVIVTHDSLSLANSTGVVQTAPTAAAGASAGDVILVAGAGSTLSTVGHTGKGTAQVVASNTANNVKSNGGMVLIAAANNSLSINGDIVTSGSGSG